MRQSKYKIKELEFFRNGCDIEFLRSLQHYHCYKTDKGNYIAVMQLNNYPLILKKAIVVNKDGSLSNTVLENVPAQLGVKYNLYELLD